MEKALLRDVGNDGAPDVLPFADIAVFVNVIDDSPPGSLSLADEDFS